MREGDGGRGGREREENRARDRRIERESERSAWTRK